MVEYAKMRSVMSGFMLASTVLNENKYERCDDKKLMALLFLVFFVSAS